MPMAVTRGVSIYTVLVQLYSTVYAGVMDRKIWVFLKKKEWFFWFFWFFSQITVYKRMDKWFFYLGFFGFFGFFPKKPGFFGFFPIVIAFVDIL